MAKVNAQVLGGQIKTLDAVTVAEVKQALGVSAHSATVNGNPAADDYTLSDYEFISLAPAVKGN